MSRRTALSAVLTAFAFALAPATSSATDPPPPVLYMASGAGTPSDLYTVDSATGAVTSVGPTGFSITGLAEDPTSGILYGVSAVKRADPNPERQLLTINRATGAATVVGSLGSNASAQPFKISDIAFTDSGQLFGWSETGDDLATIDKASGATAIVGESGQGTAGDGMDFDRNGTLFAMLDGANDFVYTVDTNTGAATPGAPLTGSPTGPNAEVSAGSYSCDRSTFFATTNEDQSDNFLVTIDPGTGVVSSRGATLTGADALAWVCPKLVEFEVAAVQVNENAGTATLSVARRGGIKGPVSVNFATADGSAVAGQDYTATSGTLSWATNDTAAKTVTVPILDDAVHEDNESFTVNLSDPTSGASLGVATATVTIVDDDPAALTVAKGRPRVTVAGVSTNRCLRSAFSARVRVRPPSGGRIRFTRVTLDGRQLRRTSHTAFSVPVNVRALRNGSHTLRVTSTLTRASGARSTTATRRFSVCRAAIRPVPRFTG